MKAVVYKGKTYRSLSYLCIRMGVSRDTVWKRINNQGMDLETAVDLPTHIDAVDHLGLHYRSIAAMTRAWRISSNVFCARIERGWSLKKALTEPVHTEYWHRSKRTK